jgi:regulator of protease activity HflC (stomatin/prohibitin superfamily)
MRVFEIRVCVLACSLVASGCAAVVEGHERALFYSARNGLSHEPVGSGWYWHMPWNDYITYDLRWTSHKEQIHIHSKDGLHMNIDLVVVSRPNPAEIYQLETDVGPHFYDSVIRAAVFAAARDAAGRFNHLDIATQTHMVEEAIHAALLEHLKGKHVELSEVAVQHFDLPPEVEQAANRTASANQLLGAKDVELALAGREAKIEQEKKRGTLETQGLERRLRAEQELSQTTLQIRIEEEKRKADLARVQAESEAVKIRAEGEAHATRVRAEAEKIRVQSLSQNLSPNYVRVQALEALAKALGRGKTKVMVLPVGKDGLPAYFQPFLNPFGPLFGKLAGSQKEPRAAQP